MKTIKNKFWILNDTKDLKTGLVCSSKNLRDLIINSDIIISVDPGIKNFSFIVLEPKKLKLIIYHRLILKQGSMIYKDLTKKLDNIMNEIKENKKITLIIEKQLPRSIVMSRIEQHVISYFIIKYPDSLVIQVNPRNRILMLKNHYKKDKITKKDSVEWASSHIEKIEDNKAKEIIKSLKKKDDFSDTICQVYSLIYLLDSAPEVSLNK